jgi:cytochrome bd-type quinol oxidase subunit 2
MSTRREFLKRGTLMALAAGVPLALTEKASGMVNATSQTAGLTLAAFKSQLGSSFFINNENGKVKTRLVAVTSFATRKQTAAGKEGFSLVFRGPQDATLNQDTYLIEHEELGMFSFLIVPVWARDARSAYYEAVINRLHS